MIMFLITHLQMKVIMQMEATSKFFNKVTKKRSKSFTSNRDNEHVTFPMWDGRMKITKYRLKKEISDKNVRITIDNEEDVEVIRNILSFPIIFLSTMNQ